MKIEENNYAKNCATKEMFEKLAYETQFLNGDPSGSYVQVFFDVSDGEVFGVFQPSGCWITRYDNDNIDYLCTIHEAMTAEEVELCCVRALEEKMALEVVANIG